MEETIFSQIRAEADDFFSSTIEVVPGYSFNQYDAIKRNHLYANSKFEDSSTYMGREKLFFNIVSSPCEVATRMLNIDTKDIRLWPMNPKSYFSTFLLEKELKFWLKQSKMGKVLNQIAEEAPKFGSVVIEKTDDGAEVVDIRRLMNDPTVASIKDSRFVTTVHYMTPSELRGTGWDNVEDAITQFSNKETSDSFEDSNGNVMQVLSTPYIKVHKRYGEVPEKWLGGKTDKMVKALFIVAGVDDTETNDKGEIIGENGLVLFKSKWYKDWPYKDFHYTKVKGRWLGVGVIEMLWDVQTRLNELKNQKRLSMELSTLHLFQTKDKTIVRNALTDLQNGDILISNSGIEPIVNEERNLSAFQSEEESYKAQSERLSFAFEAVTGANLPSSTPATNALIASQGASSVFAFKRENLSLFLQEFFNDLVIPQLLKDLNEEHIMRFVGSAQDLLAIDLAVAETAANDYIKANLLQGKYSTQQEVDFIKQLHIDEFRKLGESRFLKIKKAFYDKAEFEFDFNITNEQVDPAVLVQNTQAVFLALAQNPGILNDPRIKLLFYKYAENLGVSPAEIELADQQLNKQNQSINGIQSPQQPSPIQPAIPSQFGQNTPAPTQPQPRG